MKNPCEVSDKETKNIVFCGLQNYLFAKQYIRCAGGLQKAYSRPKDINLQLLPVEIVLAILRKATDRTRIQANADSEFVEYINSLEENLLKEILQTFCLHARYNTRKSYFVLIFQKNIRI